MPETPWPSPLPQVASPNGLYPYPAQPWANLAHYAEVNQRLQWVVSGSFYQGRISSRLLNLRPEWSPGETAPNYGESVFGMGTYGLSRYLTCMVRPVGTANPPATYADLLCFTQELVAVTQSDRLGRLPEVERTSDIQNGGRDAATASRPAGCSIIQLTVPAGCRFWLVDFRFQWPTASGAPPTFAIDLGSN